MTVLCLYLQKILKCIRKSKKNPRISNTIFTKEKNFILTDFNPY